MPINNEAIYCPSFCPCTFPSGRFNAHLRAPGSISHSTRSLEGAWLRTRGLQSLPSKNLIGMGISSQTANTGSFTCEKTQSHTCRQDKSETVIFVLLILPSGCYPLMMIKAQAKCAPNFPALDSLLQSLLISPSLFMPFYFFTFALFSIYFYIEPRKKLTVSFTDFKIDVFR